MHSVQCLHVQYMYSTEGIMSHFELPLLHYPIHSVLQHIACSVWDQAGLTLSAAGEEKDMFRVFPISENFAQYTDWTYFGAL